MGKLLLIEDDLEMQELIIAYLVQSKYEVLATHSPSKAIEILNSNEVIDLIILDLILPEMDGFSLCKKIKKITSVPIIISSARGDVYNKVEGLERGADDYLAKPYEPVELLARINALLRRLKPKSFEFDNLYINVEQRVVSINGEYVELTTTEFDILLLLVENKQKPISREQIANSISAINEDSTLRSIDTHIRNIRYKINDNAKKPKFIQSVWGIGYKFCF